MTRTTLDNVPTPALVIDEAKAKRNIARIAAYAREHKVGVRPHTKTHKSLAMAREQLAAGAIGLTVAKVGEAEVMAEAGEDLLLAYPALDPPRTQRLAELARRRAVRVGIDSRFAADALAAAARSADSTLGILIDLDVGYHRTGVQSPEAALELAQHVDRTLGLSLDGLVFFPGHIQCPWDHQEAQLAAIQEFLTRTLDLFRRAGLEAKIVSGGSTPTALRAHLVPALTEIRPGTYVYHDRNCLAGGWCTIDDCAARVLCTVISDAVPGKVILDGGSKTFTSDRLLVNPDTSGFGLLVDYPHTVIWRLSEEHGEVDIRKAQRTPQLGERVQVIPNHICPCVNLQSVAWLKHEDGTLEELPIDARGKLS